MSATETGMQQKAGTNYDGPAPVDVAPVATMPAGAYASLASKLANLGLQSATPPKKQTTTGAMANATVASTSTPSTASSLSTPSTATALTSLPGAPNLSIIILDSGALLTSGSASLHGAAGFELLARLWSENAHANSGSGPRFVTVPAVIAELRDEASRARMAALPFKIEIMTPQQEAIREVYRFASLTGDAAVLSTTDVHILALTYQLEMQHNGRTFIRTEPKRSKAMDAISAAVSGQGATATATTTATTATTTSTTSTHPATASTTAPSQTDAPSVTAAPAATTDAAATKETPSSDSAEQISEQQEQHTVNDEDDDEDEEQEPAGAGATTTTDAAASSQATESESKQPGANDGDDDGEGEWITPQNIHRHRQGAGRGDSKSSEPESTIAMITTDYSMQNVGLQMGLRQLSIRGRSIRSIRHFMKRCHGCGCMCSDLSKVFCPTCGHHTMIRVSLTINRGGVVRFWHGPRVLTKKGTVYSIPRPRAGRHANNLKLAEDTVDERIRKGGGHNWGAANRKEKKPSQLFEDSLEFGMARSGPSNNENVYGYGRRNPNAHNGRGQKKKKNRK